MYAAISSSNSKMGAVPSVSLPPIKTCSPGLPCFKHCYAKQQYAQYPSVRLSYNRNLARYLSDPARYFGSVAWYIRRKKLGMFRWNVSGDLPDAGYLTGVIQVAKALPDCKFLIFTKKYELVKGVRMPKNLTLVLSAWPTMKLPRTRRPIAFMRDSANDKRIKNAIECQGGCATCSLCWNLRMSRKNVVFNLHSGALASAKARRQKKLKQLAAK